VQFSEQNSRSHAAYRQAERHIFETEIVPRIIRRSSTSTAPRPSANYASNLGLEGFSKVLHQEVAEFGIKVTVIEPGGYATDWAGSSAAQAPCRCPHLAS